MSVLIKSTLKRFENDGSPMPFEVEFGPNREVKYQFVPDADGDPVCEIADEAHVATLFSTGVYLPKVETKQKQKPGPKKGEKKEEKPSAESESTEQKADENTEA